MIRIGERSKERLKKILLSIACQDANEVIKFTREQLSTGQARLKRSVALAVSSMKIKSSGDSVDCEVKFYDKLKAIELYFKLCGIAEGATDGTLYIDYGYISPEENED